MVQFKYDSFFEIVNRNGKEIIMTHRLDTLLGAMIAHNAGDPKRIQHFLKVHALARYIGGQEGLAGEALETLEAAACVHDIGIRLAEERFGYSNGKLQEELGPAAAEAMLTRLGFPEETVRRAAWLVGHHHTYSDIQGADYRILVEADFLVNLFEKNAPREEIETALDRIFRTDTGRKLCKTMFGLE